MAAASACLLAYRLVEDWCPPVPTLLHRLPGRRAMEHGDKLEPAAGCTKSALNKMMHNTPCGDHLEVRGSSLRGCGLTQAKWLTRLT